MGKTMSTEKYNKKTITAIAIGVGNRGYGYANYVREAPEDYKVVAVADPRSFYKRRVQKLCNIPDERAFDDWKQVAELDKFADCVVICTQDQLHKDPAIAFARKGYNILLEKPMAVTEEDCREIVAECKKNNVLLTVCHVLRYTPWVQKLKEIIDQGGIGDVVNIQHLEPVGYWYFAHSFVRGNWHKESESAFSLLAKCCHDLDLIAYWMGDRKCHSVSSFGHLSHFNQECKVGYWHFAHSYVRGNWHKEADSSSSLLAKCCHDLDLVNYWMGDKQCHSISSFGYLSHFNKDSKPAKAASRCLDCPTEVESACPYSAQKVYIDNVKMGNTRWPVNVITETPDIESVVEALRTGPYGRCVYDMDNDVLSQQTVNMQFTGGATATMSMIAFTKDICARKVRIFGTKGELTYEEGYGDVNHCDFTTGQTFRHPLPSRHTGHLSGHGGADYYMFKSFVEALKEGDKSKILTGADEALASHLLVFAAEKARKENCVVTISPELQIK